MSPTKADAFLSFYALYLLKGNKIHILNSCIVISIYELDTLSIKKATDYHNN